MVTAPRSSKPKPSATDKPESTAEKPAASVKPASTRAARTTKPPSVKKPRVATQKSKALKSAADDGKTHPSWKDMIKACIVDSNDRKGVSRATIKKYISERYHLDVALPVNLSHLNRAITNGAEDSTFALPKGPSGRVKLAPKNKPAPTNENLEPAPVKKAALAKKATPAKKVAPAKKAPAPKKPAVKAPTKTAKTTKATSMKKTTTAKTVEKKKAGAKAATAKATKATTTRAKPAAKPRKRAAA